jgi:hypothetical protein
MTQIPVGAQIRLTKPVHGGHTIEVVGTVENVHTTEVVSVKFYGLLAWISVTKETTIEEIKNNG